MVLMTASASTKPGRSGGRLPARGGAAAAEAGGASQSRTTACASTPLMKMGTGHRPAAAEEQKSGGGRMGAFQ